ncbi:unnamed protein product [Ranitomeya imitator]|uniref:Thioredoxin domain-containing protein n=1 Tax=Ranitomeya imitator TaxID=111125 RepID=A0ABN9L6B3_9NEOB|nr:unnamed protein product [Ranitomeya imitator]
MKPDYEKAAEVLREESGSGALAAVDATVHRSLAERFHVSGFPTLKYFADGEEKYTVPHLRSEQKILEFMHRSPRRRHLQSRVGREAIECPPLLGDDFREDSERRRSTRSAVACVLLALCGASDASLYLIKPMQCCPYYFSPEAPAPEQPEVPWSEQDSAVHHLTDADFDQFVQDHPSVLVMFYAPCKSHSVNAILIVHLMPSCFLRLLNGGDAQTYCYSGTTRKHVY